MSPRFPVAAALLGAACGSGRLAPTPLPPPLAPPATTTPPTAAAPGSAPAAPGVAPAAGIRYGPSALRYAVHRQVHIEQILSGQIQVQNLGARIFVGLAITGPADSVGYPATFSVDSVAADSGTPALVSNNIAKVRKLVFAGRVVRRGEFVNAVASDSALAQSAAQLLGNFRDFLPRLPGDGVRPGAAWTDTVDATQRGADASISRRAIVLATASAGPPSAGLSSVRVETTQTYTVSGTGKNAGQPYELSGSGTASATAVITIDGRYVGGEGRDSTSFTIRLPVQGVQVPVTQVTRTTVAVLP